MEPTTLTVPLLPFLALVITFAGLVWGMARDYAKQTATLQSIAEAIQRQGAALEEVKVESAETAKGVATLSVVLSLLSEGETTAAKAAMGAFLRPETHTS